VVVVAVSLVALVVLPFIQERRVRALSDEITTTLEPARERARDLALLHARQVTRFQSYLLTGDPTYRVRYEALAQDGQEVYADLTDLVERTDLEIREPLADLYTAVQQWQVGHRMALSGEPGRVAYLGALPQEQARWDRVLQGSRELESALDREVEQARARVSAARGRQTALTLALAGLALLGTLSLIFIGRRLRSLVEEADRRRGDALRARRAMEAVLEATADGVLGLDLEGRCTRLNRTGESLLGMTEHDARGRSVHHLLHGRAPPGVAHPESECPVLERLRNPGEGRETVSEADDEVWRRDGTSFPARWHLRPMVDGREVRGGVLTLTDMTGIREAEEALRQAVRAREEVVAIVSHDLRNPLGTVSGAVDLIRDLDLSPEKEAEQLDVIRRTTSRMERLVRDLLDVARIEAGHLPVDPRPVDVGPLVEESVEMAARRGRSRQVRVEAELEPSLPAIHADPGRVEQVLSNLLGNALKFTPAGGWIRVRVRSTPDRVRISVTDSGRGIPEDDRKRLFDRYWQPRSRSRRRRGAGLGLSIVKGIVEAHGGRVWVESEVGVGSTFHTTLPRADAIGAHGDGAPAADTGSGLGGGVGERRGPRARDRTPASG
jgi:PAS domain S-box-containing protein